MNRILFLLLCLPLLAYAQIYKWVDEKGRVHYGEKPPAGAKSSTVRKEATPPGAPPSAAKGDLSAQEADFRRRQVERQQAEEKQAEQAKQRQVQCDNAKNQLAAAESAGRHVSMKGGERVYATDAEREASLVRMREQVSRACR
jgi:hypothetical protein